MLQKTFTNLRTLSFACFIGAMLMVGTMAPTHSAQAQSVTDLQQMINALIAQITQLQTQLANQNDTDSTVCPYVWTRDLSIGTRGQDVMALQQFLNQSEDTSIFGVSPGEETEYYGNATAQAVSKFQVKYRAEILDPAGLVNPTGFFGSAARAKANSLCTSDNQMVLQGEATLQVFEITPASNQFVQFGDQDVEIAQVVAEFRDGDAEIARFDVTLVNENGLRAVDYFESVALWANGGKAAEAVVNGSNGNTVRISGASIFALESDEVEILIAATLKPSSPTTVDSTWSVRVDGIRYFDADDVATSDSATDEMGESVEFVVEEGSLNDKLTVKVSRTDPDSMTIVLEEDEETDWITIFAFDLEAGGNDVEIERIPVVISTGDVRFTDMVDDVRLVIDGEPFDSLGGGGRSGGPITLSFDIDGDVVVESNDKVAAELEVMFNARDSRLEGSTISAFIDATDIIAEGEDDLTSSQLFGLAEGNAHTLLAGAVFVEVVDTDVSTNQDRSAAVFEFEFEVAALDQNVYVPKNFGGAVEPAKFSVEPVSRNSIPDSISSSLSSSADEDGPYYVVSEAQTETFVLSISYTTAVSGTYKAEFESFGYITDLRDAVGTYVVVGEQSDRVNLVGDKPAPEELETPTLSTNKSTYRTNDDIKVTWTSDEDRTTEKDWIGLYKVGASGSSWIEWEYIRDGKESGSVTLTAPPPGTYELRLYADNQSDVLLATSDSFEVSNEVEAPERNAYNCTRSGSVANGQTACYGMWDYGNDFGGDKAMCGSFGRGDTTGCVITAPVCSSGFAEATDYFSNRDLKQMGSGALQMIASNLNVNATTVQEGVAGMWEYQCVQEQIVPGEASVQGVSTSVDQNSQLASVLSSIEAILLNMMK